MSHFFAADFSTSTGWLSSAVQIGWISVIERAGRKVGGECDWVGLAVCDVCTI
jgi:hypothetical protein